MKAIRNDVTIDCGPKYDRYFFPKRKEYPFYFYIEYNNAEERRELNVTYFSLNKKKDDPYVKDRVILDMPIELLRELLRRIDLPLPEENPSDEFNAQLTSVAFAPESVDLDKAKDVLRSINETYRRNYEMLNERGHRWMDYLPSDRQCKFFGYDLCPNWDMKIRAYNVGQANCSALMRGDTPVAVFDLGRVGKNTAMTKMLKNLSQEGVVIISHYDCDHINKFSELSQAANKRLFIIHQLPSHIGMPIYNQFISYLARNCRNVWIIPDNYLIKPLRLGCCMEIYQGMDSRRSRYQSTPENRHSLVVKLSINRKIAVIPGDALEEEFDINESEIFYISIPHHGCSYQGKLPFCARNAFLFVAASGHGRYHHPQENHIDLYTKNNTRVYRFGHNAKMYNGKKLLKNDNLSILLPNTSEYIDFSF